MSQSRLGELVGRSASTVRSWEKDNSTPTDPEVLDALVAVLGVDQRTLYDKAGVEVPAEDAGPTVEQALATLFPDGSERGSDETHLSDEQAELRSAVTGEGSEVDVGEPEADEPQAGRATSPPYEPVSSLTATPSSAEPAFKAPPEPYSVSRATPPIAEPSYLEDASQRQLYRVRNLATIVLLVALAVVLLWAISTAIGALGDWWDDFFGLLRI